MRNENIDGEVAAVIREAIDSLLQPGIPRRALPLRGAAGSE
jgi:hypothetical protein